MFFRQILDYDCQPTALANALIWAGQRINYWVSAKEFMDHCDCTAERGGCSYWGFSSLLYRTGRGLFSVTTVENPLLVEIAEHLLSGGSIILSYIFFDQAGNKCRHVVFLPGMSEDKRRLLVVNSRGWRGESKALVEEASASDMRNLFLYHRSLSDPTTAYFLRKEWRV